MQIESAQVTDLKTLMQRKWLLYGVCGHLVKLGDVITGKPLVIEAPDGTCQQTESLLALQTYHGEPPDTTFAKEPLTTVSLRETKELQLDGQLRPNGGWEFVDEKNHVWVALGIERMEEPGKKSTQPEKLQELSMRFGFKFTWSPKAPDPKFDPFDL
jgi:hypothetical protein